MHLLNFPIFIALNLLLRSSSEASVPPNRGCRDSPFPFFLELNGAIETFTCDDIGKGEDLGRKQCRSTKELATHCPKSCKKFGCQHHKCENSEAFFLEKENTQHCNYFEDLDDDVREAACAKIPGLKETCRQTCRYCDSPYEKYFNRISTFPICSQIDLDCDTDEETVAEIVTVSSDGQTLIYTDSEQKNIGFVDISYLEHPMPDGTVALEGEPTSVAVLGDFALVAINTSADYVNTSGQLVAVDIVTKTIVKTWELGGQPDAVAVSPDGSYVAVAIENERDEDLGDGEPPQVREQALI